MAEETSIIDKPYEEGKKIRIVLVSPLYGGNIGSVCRAMANMGLSRLYIVDPRVEEEDWQNAKKMAVHAGGILENAVFVKTLAEAVDDCSMVAGATARDGLYRQHVKLAREVAPDLLFGARHGEVALVFGREDNGLENDEVQLCTHLIRIPSAPEYRSINLAQAAMICMYEIYAAASVYTPPDEKSKPVEGRHRQRLFEIWREAMLEIGFMKEDKADHMMQGFSRIFSRGIRTEDDANIMLGVARQSQWARRQGK